MTGFIRESRSRLIASIRRFGQPRPILVRAENCMIIAGHGVHQAMFEAGESEIEVVLWHVDQETADQYMSGDNRFSELSYSDDDRRRALLEEVGEDLGALGFSQDEVDKILNDGAEDLAIVEIETGEVADEFWISVRGPLAKQALALQRLKQLLGELGDRHHGRTRHDCWIVAMPNLGLVLIILILLLLFGGGFGYHRWGVGGGVGIGGLMLIILLVWLLPGDSRCRPAPRLQ